MKYTHQIETDSEVYIFVVKKRTLPVVVVVVALLIGAIIGISHTSNLITAYDTTNYSQK